MRTNTFPIVAAKSACVNAHIHIPCCIDVWLHLQRSSAKGVLLAAMRTLIYEEKGRSRVSPGGYGGGGRIHLGHASCYMSVFVGSLFYPFSELSHCSQLWGWCEVTSAWQRGPWDLVGIPHFPLAPPTSGKTWSAAKTRITMLLHIEQWW